MGSITVYNFGKGNSLIRVLHVIEEVMPVRKCCIGRARAPTPEEMAEGSVFKFDTYEEAQRAHAIINGRVMCGRRLRSELRELPSPYMYWPPGKLVAAIVLEKP